VVERGNLQVPQVKTVIKPFSFYTIYTPPPSLSALIKMSHLFVCILLEFIRETPSKECVRG